MCGEFQGRLSDFTIEKCYKWPCNSICKTLHANTWGWRILCLLNCKPTRIFGFYARWLASLWAFSHLYARCFGRFRSIINLRGYKTASNLLIWVWGHVYFEAKLFLVNPVKNPCTIFQQQIPSVFYKHIINNDTVSIIILRFDELFHSVVGYWNPTHSIFQERCGQYRIHCSFNNQTTILYFFWRVWMHFSVGILYIITDNIQWWDMSLCTLWRYGQVVYLDIFEKLSEE